MKCDEVQKYYMTRVNLPHFPKNYVEFIKNEKSRKNLFFCKNFREKITFLKQNEITSSKMKKLNFGYGKKLKNHSFLIEILVKKIEILRKN